MTEIDEVKVLYAQRAKLWKQTNEITNKIHEIKLRYEKKQSGLEIGCIIRDKFGKVYKVTKIEIWDTDMRAHSVKAVPKLKDGSFGTAIRNLWWYSDGLEVIK